MSITTILQSFVKKICPGPKFPLSGPCQMIKPDDLVGKIVQPSMANGVHKFGRTLSLTGRVWCSVNSFLRGGLWEHRKGIAAVAIGLPIAVGVVHVALQYAKPLKEQFTEFTHIIT